uniref:Uncharacterized protein n=1 Tax=Rhizophora mucronata TaxID=61149 RepID=A0A2P2QJJ2_RHIMU
MWCIVSSLVIVGRVFVALVDHIIIRVLSASRTAQICGCYYLLLSHFFMFNILKFSVKVCSDG